VTKIAAPGDPAPGGGVFSFVGGEVAGFVDGTYMPTGPVPDINASGQIAYRGALTSGVEGLLVQTSESSEWFVRTGEATPGGGTYLNFFGPVLNDAGQIAFVAQYQPEPSILTAAWFAGTPKGWRKVLGFGDAIAGGTCQTLAASRAPMQPLGEDGSVTVWCVAEYAGGVQAEVLAVSRPDIGLQVVARQNEPAPGGGLLRRMNAWPSISRSGVTVSASTFGTPSFGAHILGLLPTEITSLRASKPFSLSWVAQLNLSYDTIRGTLGALRATGPPANGDCVASGIRAASYSEPESACPAGVGDGCFYLVRGVNACGVSTWDSAAFDSNVSCP
jgi:hypothetical protein